MAPRTEYLEYVEDLRVDFWFSCAYCSIAEFEAAGIRFTVDHYVPQDRDATKIAEYENLMWCCDPCNEHKWTRPTDAELAQGYRFFRPDQDLLDDHLELKGVRLEPRTVKVGSYSIQVLDLNRQPLRRLREIRERHYGATAAIAAGTRALRGISIEALPVATRFRFQEVRDRLANQAGAVGAEFEETLLREFNRSVLRDEDLDVDARTKERRAFLRSIKALGPAGPKYQSKA